MLRDIRLSIEARGVLSMILSHPEDWQFNLAWLCKTAGIGRDKAHRIIKQLCEFGYCRRRRDRNGDGTLGAYEYEFTDEPSSFGERPSDDQIGRPSDWKPVTGEPAPGNPPPTKSQSYKHNHKVEDKCESAVLEAGIDGDDGGGLPFTPKTLRMVEAMGVDLNPLIKRYRGEVAKKAQKRKRPIKDPNAYLLTMASDEVENRTGTPPDIARQLLSADMQERTAAIVAVASMQMQAKPAAPMRPPSAQLLASPLVQTHRSTERR
jgi:hypothetical protein